MTSLESGLARDLVPRWIVAAAGVPTCLAARYHDPLAPVICWQPGEFAVSIVIETAIMNLFAIALVALVAQPSSASFRTRIAPRIDPVFGDVASLRRSVDRYIVLAAEMRELEDRFSNAVHDTLAELATTGSHPGPATAVATAKRMAVCAPAVVAPYQRARSAGARYVVLGQELELRMREIRAAESDGDTVGLTPDYRRKVERARQDHAQLRRSLHEMLVAFHDQLEKEMRHTGCSPASITPAQVALVETKSPAEEPSREALPDHGDGRAAQASPDAAVAPVAWVEIDSSLCQATSRLVVDGETLGQVEGGRRSLVRLTDGPHDICVLPTSDARHCGDKGTVRHAYVHDGWVLQVRCRK